MASLDAPYGPYPGEPRTPITDPKLTMRPPPWSLMWGNTACMAHSVPFGPVSNSRSMSLARTSSRGMTGRKDWALLTRPSTRPKRSMVWRTVSWIPSRSATSPGHGQDLHAIGLELGGDGLQTLLPAGGDGEGGPLPAQVAGDAETDALRRTGDDHDPLGHAEAPGPPSAGGGAAGGPRPQARSP